MKAWIWGEDSSRCSDPADPKRSSWKWSHIRFLKTQDSMFQVRDLKHWAEIKIPWFQGVLDSCFHCHSHTSGHGYMIWYRLLPILNSCTPYTAAAQSYYCGAKHTTTCPMEALWSMIYIIMLTLQTSCQEKQEKKKKAPFFFLNIRFYLSGKRFPTFVFVRLLLWDISSSMSNSINLDKDDLNFPLI